MPCKTAGILYAIRFERAFALLKEFERKYHHVTNWIAELITFIGIEFGKCPLRNDSHGIVIKGGRAFRCYDCRITTYYLAKTFFRRCRIPRSWLLFFYFVDAGECVSAKLFHVVTGHSYPAAHLIFGKVGIACKPEATSSCFCEVSPLEFKSIIRKRSADTLAQRHPCSELEVLAAGSEQFPPDTAIEACSLEEQKVLLALGNEAVSFDELIESIDLTLGELMGALAKLEFTGFVEQLMGNMFRRAKVIPSNSSLSSETGEAELDDDKSDEAKLNEAKNAAIFHIEKLRHGSSFKLLEISTAHHNICANPAVTADVVLQVCLRYGPVTGVEIRNHKARDTVLLFFESASMSDCA
jgi:hypothetical protein